MTLQFEVSEGRGSPYIVVTGSHGGTLPEQFIEFARALHTVRRWLPGSHVRHCLETATIAPESRPELEARANSVVDALFEVAPAGTRMPLSVCALETGGRVYHFKGLLNVTVAKMADTMFCEHEELGIYGEAPTFTESWTRFAEYLDTLYQEYVETDETLHGSGNKLADRIRSIVANVESVVEAGTSRR